jgi:Zn-dependent protease
MKNSVKIGSVAGIGLYLHWTFLVLLAGIFAFYLFQGNTVVSAAIGVSLLIAVFVCVLLHELGHALTARKFDVPTRDITLYPIGGIARLQRIPEEPIQEFWIAVAGPAVNVAIAVILGAALFLTDGSFSPEVFMRPNQNVLATLVWLNVILVGFNLLPAFPMDGGRVLRALLAMRMDYARATQIAANVGQGMAILFGIVGLVGFNPILLFIALFVYVGAQQEAQQAMMRTVTEGMPVRQAMMTRFTTLSPGDPLSVAIDELLAGPDHDFPVVDDGRIVGVLTRKRLLRGLAEQGRDAPVHAFLEPNCFAVQDTAMLEEAFRRMAETNCSSVPVTRNGKLVGLLSLENVGELMMISSALKKAGS